MFTFLSICIKSLAVDPNMSAEKPSEPVQGKFPTMLFFILPYILLKTSKRWGFLKIFFSLYFQCPTIGQKKRRRNYVTALFARAYEDVKERGMSVYRAARECGIPESTLRDRHLGIQSVDSLPSHGSAPLLSRKEEKSLVDHIEYMSHIGYGYSR